MKDASKERKKKTRWWAIVLVLMIAVPIIWFTIYTLQNRVIDIEVEFDSQILEAFSEVREGNGVAEAAAYEGHGPHPTVLLNSSGKKHQWTDFVPMDWRPINVTDVELVAFVGEQKSKVFNTCHYWTGPDIKLIEFYLYVELREAQTGEIVSRTAIYGPGPGPCPQWALRSTTAIYGSHVEFGALRSWVEPYVTGDACMPTQMQEVVADAEILWISPFWHSESESLIETDLWTDSYETYDYECGYKPWEEEAKDVVVNGTAIELTSPQLWFNFYVFDGVNFNLWKTGKSYAAYYETQKATSVSFRFSISSEDEVPDAFYFVTETYSEGETPGVCVNATINWVEKNPKFEYTDSFLFPGLSASLSEKARDFVLEVTATEANNRKFNLYILDSSNYDSWFDGESYAVYYEVRDISTTTFFVALNKNEATSSINFVVENPNSNIDSVVQLSAIIHWIECVDTHPG